MKIYLAGICGTFMAGLARLGQEMGYIVGGCDSAAWPPMSRQLAQLGITPDLGWKLAHPEQGWDRVIIGNVLSRGNPFVEKVLAQRLPFVSGPQWLYDEVLSQRKTVAIAGTHGKTTTSAMLAWILESAGLPAGFLIGGCAKNFPMSARLGAVSMPFVVEADEYDSAFFDKRPKFLHYHPHIAVFNNLEFDHADIYPDIRAVQRQFHYLLRTVPDNGTVLYRAGDANLQGVINAGIWTPAETFGIAHGGLQADWTAHPLPVQNGSRFAVSYRGKEQGVCHMRIAGEHNVANALTAIAAAYHAQISVPQSLVALESFAGVCRRLEVVAAGDGIIVYDDFAHHPTAIAASLHTVRQRMNKGRVLAVFEPRSNSMRSGVHCQGLATAFADADQVFMYQPVELNWSLQTTLPAAQCFTDTAALLESVCEQAHSGDCIVVMSNGVFDNLPRRIGARILARTTC